MLYYSIYDNYIASCQEKEKKKKKSTSPLKIEIISKKK